MGVMKKKYTKAYADIYNNTKAAEQEEKPDFVPFTDCKVQLLVESTTDGIGNEGKKDEYFFYQMNFKILTGKDTDRVIKRKFYMPQDPENPTERDENAIAKTKKCLTNVGITKITNLGTALESLEDCIIGATIWTPAKENQYGMKISIPFFNELIKGADEGETATVPPADSDDLEYV